MCSVIGYVGKRLSCPLVLEGLKRLEYRGYDSAGFACVNSSDRSLSVQKAVGSVKQLEAQIADAGIDGYVAVGHTRWATHGQATKENAHPHLDCTKRIAVVHNGIIENFQDLKDVLVLQGHLFVSDTDSEVLAHLFEQYVTGASDTHEAFIRMVGQLKGAYAFVIISLEYPDILFVARRGSPLCIGVGKEEMFVASDPLAFAQQVEYVAFVPERTCGVVSKDSFVLYDREGMAVQTPIEQLEAEWIAVEKGEHEHFMLKEMYEQKQAIARTVHFYQSMKKGQVEETLGVTQDFLRDVEKIYLIGCGTSWHAGRIAEFFFESVTGVPAAAVLASEFRHRTFFPHPKALYIAISQSGETADVLETIRMINSHGLSTVALTNVASSSLVRECQGFWLTQAGPEIAVASTKAFSTQLTSLYWLAHYVAQIKGRIDQKQLIQAERELLTAGELLEATLEEYKHEVIAQDAPIYSAFNRYIFLGRHISYPFALEAALKLKEISYIFAQAYPAGELKHGPLALVEKVVPVVVFSHSDPVIYHKLLANVQEVKARDGHVIAFALEGQYELIAAADRAFVVPQSAPLLAPLVMAGLMQFFCYAIANACGRSIDKPRNLAKSVTVE